MRRRVRRARSFACFVLVAAALASPASADLELLKKSQNPVGDLISLPFESNLDGDVGSEDALVYTLNLKPVYPIHLSDDWLLINRFTIPVIAQGERFEDEGSRFGLGDTTYQAFFSPRESYIIWGLGPAVTAPTHTNARLGSDQWLAGPAFVALAKPGPWLVGSLVQQFWSFAGPGDGKSTFSWQYFLNYNFDNGWYLTSTPTMKADWKRSSEEAFTIPVGGGIGKLVRIAGAPIDMKLQGFGFAERPSGGPDWSLQFQLKLLFPK